MSKKRGSFSGGLGFVFAAAGSAVGWEISGDFRIMQLSTAAEHLSLST